MPSGSVWDKHKDKLESAKMDLFNEYGKILYEENIHSITTYVSVGKCSDTGRIEMLCSGTGMLCGLFAVIGGMDTARK